MDKLVLIQNGNARLAHNKRDEWQKKANDYSLTLKYGRRTFTFDWWQGIGINGEPTISSVMPNLFMDASVDGDFNGFCAEFGYDADSRKAEAIWNACKRTRKALKRVFGEQYGHFEQKYQDR